MLTIREEEAVRSRDDDGGARRGIDGYNILHKGSREMKPPRPLIPINLCIDANSTDCERWPGSAACIKVP